MDEARNALRQLQEEARKSSEEQKSKRPVTTKGTYSPGGDKYRVTAILFQTVEKWFDPNSAPQGFGEVRSQKDQSMPPLQMILIVFGSAQCRLEDIDSAGKWNKDVQFKSKGQPVNRTKGQSARGMMAGWVRLRSQLGEDQFLSVRIWQQPAAWADEVISCWVLDLLFQYLIQSINIVDCFSGQWTAACLYTSWLNQQCQIPVGPDCTPMLQVADNAVIRECKVVGETEKAQLGLELQEQARRDGAQYQAKFGQYELFRVASRMARETSRRQETRDIVLNSLVRSQLLAFRLGESGQFQPIENQSWSVRFPRFPVQEGLQSDWVELRSDGVWDEAGQFVPPVPDWDSLGQGLLEQSCLPEQPVEDDVVMEMAPATVVGQLSLADQDMLRSPQERWASLQLPSQLKSQGAKKSASRKKSKWGSRLAGTCMRGRSKHWQNLQCQSPVPVSRRILQILQRKASRQSQKRATTKSGIGQESGPGNQCQQWQQFRKSGKMWETPIGSSREFVQSTTVCRLAGSIGLGQSMQSGGARTVKNCK